MIKRTNEELKQRLNVEFVGKDKDYQLEKATVSFEITQLEFEQIAEASRRQMNAIETLSGQKIPMHDWTDEQFVVHTYESAFRHLWPEMLGRLEELEQQVEELEDE